MRVSPSNSPTGKILVVDDHARARDSMVDILRCAGHEAQCCSSAIEALKELDSQTFDVIITDLNMPGMNGIEFMRAVGERGIDSQILMVTAFASVSSAVQAMRSGAFDYIEKPFNADDLEELVARALRHGTMVDQRSVMPAEMGEHSCAMIGEGSAMQLLRTKIAQVAPTNETVLITGESGVGKELVARAIHAVSGRSTGSLVSLNCPALSPQLMESELFGHERGSFTSADAPRVGRFELADGGTILLDEVTEIDLQLQAKLLRVLQERSFERVGSSDTRMIDVRVLATSNRDLRGEVREGRFRGDLYFRLAVVPVHVPPLRERREDIPALVEHFRLRAAARVGKEPCELDQAATDLLANYHWPGNVRELENIVTRACVLQNSAITTADELKPWLIDAASDSPFGLEAGQQQIEVGMSLQEMEQKLIEATLDHFEGHRARTAKALGIGVRTLTNKLRSYGYAPRERAFARAA